MLPKATVRIQQTQPLVAAPAPAPAIVKTPAKAAVTVDESGGSDTLFTVLSVVAFLAAAAAAALSYFAYNQFGI